MSKGPALNLSPLLGQAEGTESGPVCLVVGRGVPGGYVALFGTSECYLDGEQIAYYFGEPRLKCEIGSGPLDATVKAGKELHDWYRKILLGQRVAGGRPKWTGTFSSADECRAALLSVLHALWENGRPLTQQEAATYFQHKGGTFTKVDERQIVRWVSKLETSWPTLKADALTD